MASVRKKAPFASGVDWLAAAGALSAPASPRAPDGLDAWNERWRGFTGGVPLVITAHLGGPLALPGGPLALDALLGAAVCLREGLEPALMAASLRDVEVPLVRAPGGRFHLATFSLGTFEHHERRFINRRFPVDMAQAFGDTHLRRIQISAGLCKSYRIPLANGHVEGDALRWYAIGDRAAVHDLLLLIHYLGKRRGVGLGKVLRWEVAEAEPWGDGFPVVSPEGDALRTLPIDWPGLVEPVTGYRTMTFPYWRRDLEELCAVVTESEPIAVAPIPRTGMQGRWYVTAYAARRFARHVYGWDGSDEEPFPEDLRQHVLAEIIQESETARLVRRYPLKEGRIEADLWRGPKPRRLRYVVTVEAPPGQRLPSLVTVLPTVEDRQLPQRQSTPG